MMTQPGALEKESVVIPMNRRFFVTAILPLVLAHPTNAANGDELVLAKDGHSAYRAVVADNASPRVRTVAKDFVKIFRQMTGAAIPLVGDTSVSHSSLPGFL